MPNGDRCEDKSLEILWMNGKMGLRMNISNLTTRFTGTKNSTSFRRWRHGCVNLSDPQTLIDSHQVHLFLMIDLYQEDTLDLDERDVLKIRATCLCILSTLQTIQIYHTRSSTSFNIRFHRLPNYNHLSSPTLLLKSAQGSMVARRL